MKTATIFHLLLCLFLNFSLAFCPALLPDPAQAQDDNAEPAEKYSREELAQMLAPIALYPDTLLTQVLMASTYPIEVIEADRWRKTNPTLKDEALDEALLSQDWDPSVKAICHFPSILALMSERISQTTNIGNAFLVQEAEVMNMIQELRARARQQGNLSTNAEQKVLVERETIIIEPANPRVIYVPYYDPFSIYGPWWYPAYPPYYWGPPGLGIGVGISFWPGFYFGFSFGNWSYFDWHHHSIYIHVHKRPRYVSHDRWVTSPGPWHHAPRHRRGVAYRDKYTAHKYGQQPRRPGEVRPDARGFSEAEAPDRDRDGRRDDGRARIDRDRPVDERDRIQPDRQERQRIEPRQPSREQAAPELQQQQQIQRGQQERARTERTQQEQGRAEQDRQMRQRAEQEQRARQPADRSRAVQREQAPVQSRDNIFNRVDNGSRERKSGERGQSSRQQSRGGYSPGQGSWDDENAGSRPNRGRGDGGRDDRNRSRR
ncbi:MAG: DUF3300 domain-containing protein [Desulfobulbaceae bacterium]|nr:DUF3300 domain-containing protein [Desulfobulbaceae bacterium]